jgi:hypothetical protein
MSDRNVNRTFNETLKPCSHEIIIHFTKAGSKHKNQSRLSKSALIEARKTIVFGVIVEIGENLDQALLLTINDCEPRWGSSSDSLPQSHIPQLLGYRR